MLVGVIACGDGGASGVDAPGVDAAPFDPSDDCSCVILAGVAFASDAGTVRPPPPLEGIVVGVPSLTIERRFPWDARYGEQLLVRQDGGAMYVLLENPVLATQPQLIKIDPRSAAVSIVAWLTAGNLDFVVSAGSAWVIDGAGTVQIYDLVDRARPVEQVALPPLTPAEQQMGFLPSLDHVRKVGDRVAVDYHLRDGAFPLPGARHAYYATTTHALVEPPGTAPVADNYWSAIGRPSDRACLTHFDARTSEPLCTLCPADDMPGFDRGVTSTDGSLFVAVGSDYFVGAVHQVSSDCVYDPVAVSPPVPTRPNGACGRYVLAKTTADGYGEWQYGLHLYDSVTHSELTTAPLRTDPVYTTGEIACFPR